MSNLLFFRAGPRRQDQHVPLTRAHAKIMKPWFAPNIFPGSRVRADPRRQDQLVPLGCARAKNHETIVCEIFVVFWGRVGADPRRQDQLVPMDCANAKIVKPWFEPDVLFFQGRVRADPRRKDQLVPMGCLRRTFCSFGTEYELIPEGRISSCPWVVRLKKIVGQGTSWSQEAGSTRTLEFFR